MRLRSPTGSLQDYAAGVALLRRTVNDLRRDDPEIVQLYAARRDRDIARLLAALHEPDFAWLAAILLGQLGANESADEIARLLGAPDCVTRAAAVRGLDALGTGRFDESLRDLSHSDESEMVRRWASDAIGESGQWPNPRVLIAFGVMALSVWWLRRIRLVR